MPRHPRAALNGTEPLERPPPTEEANEEDAFEDIGLGDEITSPPKKKGIFARFGDNSDQPANGEVVRPSSGHRGFHLPGRKRGHSGQGAELGNMEKIQLKAEDDGVVK